MEMEKMGRQERENTLLRAAHDGNLRLLKKMARGLASEARGEAAVLEEVSDDEGEGFRALHKAAAAGQLEVLRYLVEDLRLDVNKRNATGCTPMFLSAFCGRATATRYFLDHGADPTIIGLAGSPLHAAAKGGHCEVVELLLARGSDADLLDSVSATPLHTAAMYGQDGALKILLEHQADPNKVWNLDHTPLSLAVAPIPTESLECVKLLIMAGADVNFINSSGVTCVMIAAEYGLSDIMKCLLDAGANPNIPDPFGRTAIEFAALHGKRGIVEMLFPLTSPILWLPEWSIDGIISHVKSYGLKPMDKHQCEKKRSELKLQASMAFKRKEYLVAGELYTNAMKLDPNEEDYATLLSNRSLCSLRLGTVQSALSDATKCRRRRPGWPKACYRQGAAFMALRDYEKACEAFADGLKLDPTSVEIATALREARDKVKNAGCADK